VSTAGGIVTVEDARLHIGALVMPGASAVKAKTGFRPGPGSSPGAVSATGTPDANVHVAPFQLLLQSGRATAAGVYVTCIDAIENINILSTPADPTNPRDDLIVAQQSDEFYADASNTFVIRHVVGTPAGVPADPAVSGSPDYVTLARVRVGAAVTTITNANITDLRTSGHANSITGGLYSVAVGGILPVASAAERTALVGVYEGLVVFRRDTDVPEVYDGAAWQDLFRFPAWTTYVPTWTGSTTNPTIGNGTINGAFAKIGKLGLFEIAIAVGSTTTVGSGTYGFGLPAGWTHATFSGQSRLVCHAMMRDQSGAVHTVGGATHASAIGTEINPVRYHAGGVVTNAAPYAWAAGDFICIEGILELA